MFKQHDRWLEELVQYTNRKQSITCTAGRMPLTAIVEEIANACADARKHDGQQVRDWQSMASDLSDALDWIGPELHELVATAAQTIHQTITNDLLVTKPSGKVILEDSKRPAVAKQTAVLSGALDGDGLLVAAWRDLLAACRDINHARHPHEHVAYLRDTLIGLSELRNQDRQYWSPIRTAVNVLCGSPTSVRQAQAMAGDPVGATVQFDPNAAVGLTEDELIDLAERCIVELPLTGNYVVWFRLHPAFVKGSISCVTHGEVTFYDAQVLAGALTDHQRARELFEVVPEELLTDEIRELQLSAKVDDCVGFEYVPQLVYARVTVQDVESHRAEETARMYLDTVLAVVGVTQGMWQVLDGTLFFDDSQSYLPSVEWGLKEPMPETVFYENDYFTTHLREMTTAGHVITAEAMQRLQPVLRLQTALTSVPRSDPEAIVMAAVRAIEHCNTWVAPRDEYHWCAFAEEYLFDEYRVEALATRAVGDVFSAVVKYIPDRSPGAAARPELRVIRKDITAPGWDLRIDRQKALAQVTTLKGIYAGHWLVRQLNETDAILSSGAALSAAVDTERQRLDARMKRLTRTRNAAIHGGLLSAAACDSLADFALIMGRKALNMVVRAIVAGEPVGSYAVRQRDEYRQRIQNLAQGGDLTNLFRLAP
ncbi:hypothetical protein [Nocardia tengchongensis]